MSKKIARTLFSIAAVVGVFAAAASGDEQKRDVSVQTGKIEQREATGQIGEPSYGYVGALGTFEVSKGDGKGMIVIHNYPDTSAFALGETKLEYVGAKRLGDIDGWVFNTRWDGSRYPSKVFFSSEQVYFGGGLNGYIAADYREATGWTWKMLPLRRMDLVQD